MIRSFFILGVDLPFCMKFIQTGTFPSTCYYLSSLEIFLCNPPNQKHTLAQGVQLSVCWKRCSLLILKIKHEISWNPWIDPWLTYLWNMQHAALILIKNLCIGTPYKRNWCHLQLFNLPGHLRPPNSIHSLLAKNVEATWCFQMRSISPLSPWIRSTSIKLNRWIDNAVAPPQKKNV